MPASLGARCGLGSRQRRDPRPGVAGGWCVTGQKVWTSGAGTADYALLLARSEATPGRAGLSFFAMDMGSSGVEVRPLRQMSGAYHFSEVFLDDVFVPEHALIGRPGEGWAVLRTMLASERAAVGGGTSGRSAGQLIELARRLGRTDDAVVRQMVATAYSRERVLDLLQARFSANAGVPAGGSVTKLLYSEHARKTANDAMSLLGLAGTTHLMAERAPGSSGSCFRRACESVAGRMRFSATPSPSEGSDCRESRGLEPVGLGLSPIEPCQSRGVIHSMPDESLFQLRRPSTFLPTAAAVGPWDPQIVHGAAVAALFAGQLAPVDCTLARLTIEILAPVPLVPLTLTASEPSGGTRVQRQEATLSADGRTVATASSVLVRRGALDLPEKVRRHDSPFDPAGVPALDEPNRAAEEIVGRSSFDSRGSSSSRCVSKGTLGCINGSASPSRSLKAQKSGR